MQNIQWNKYISKWTVENKAAWLNYIDRCRQVSSECLLFFLIPLYISPYLLSPIIKIQEKA